MAIKIVFAGTPPIAVPLLQHLAQNYDVICVMCNTDAKVGRKGILTTPITKTIAIQANISVFQPEKIDQAFSQSIKSLHPDLLVCFAYGKIFPSHFLEIFPLGGVNIHPSLLPHWRGPSPIQAAIMAGETQSGVSVQYLAKQMDAGDILVQESFAIKKNDTTASMSEYVSQRAPALLDNAIKMICDPEKSHITPQNHNNATYCPLITKDMARLNYEKSAQELECLVRAMYDSPITWTTWKGRAIQVFQAFAVIKHPMSKGLVKNGTVLGHDKELGLIIQTGQGVLCIQELKMAGKNRLSHIQFINGHQQMIGDVLE
ncbi:MAG: methionyl-tRNA formyltransferase [Spirochaetia bacterium]